GFFVYGYEDEDKLLKAIHKMASLHIASDIDYSDSESGFDMGGGEERFIVRGKIEAHSEKELEVQMELFDKIANETSGIKKAPTMAKMYFEDMIYEIFPMAGMMGNYGASCNKMPIFESKKVHDLFLKYREKHKAEIEKHKIITVWYTFISGSTIDILPQIQIPAHDPEALKYGTELWENFIKEELKYGTVHYWLGKVIGDQVVEHYRPTYFNFIKKLKNLLDPNGILNPGLLKLP
ncbi:MAG: FAD-binding oxidoreductase, partial [Candidatus Helarchaeota archaeon]|nr:FAD-binding oxidoreductase [Candidatus Helarchaeota archaeon]